MTCEAVFGGRGGLFTSVFAAVLLGRRVLGREELWGLHVGHTISLFCFWGRQMLGATEEEKNILEVYTYIFSVYTGTITRVITCI